MDANSSNPRVLVVDDNPDARTMMVMLLKVSGYPTHSAADGPTAIAAVHEFDPDIILLDVGLPRMDGYVVCEKIRNLPLSKPPVIIAVTGWGAESDIKRSRDAGFDEHVLKPVEFKQLIQTMDRLLAVRAN